MYIGYVESTATIGAIMAPVVGTFLFEIGGIFVPYFIVSVILFGFLIALLELPSTKPQVQQTEFD